VGEDFSVTDSRPSWAPAMAGARQAQAQVHAADLRAKAGVLAATDAEVATNLTGGAAGVQATDFKLDGPSPQLPPGSPQPLQMGLALAAPSAPVASTDPPETR
jgi:hypothetical protein